jgi:glycosyltransferase involved in cell wall biosynthesis
VKRLLICSRSHEPRGGADRIIADLCRELPRRGWQVSLGLAQGGRFNDVERYVEALGRDLPVRPLDGRLGTRSSRLRALRAAIRREMPDVVLSMRLFDAYEAVAREKREDGPRFAVGLRSFEPHYLVDLHRYRELVDLCVTSGELLSRLAVEYAGLSPERVTSIGGGVHAPQVARVERGAGEPFRLLYAGRLEETQKRILDLPALLEALDRNEQRFILDVAGEGPASEDLRERLSARIESGQVRWHGWVSRQDLYERFFPSADCLLHFSAWEGITIAPREAMAHGAVPVITRFQGQRIEGQFIEGVSALTFPVGDIEAAAACVARLAGDPLLWSRLSEQGKLLQTGVYSFHGSMDAWASALDACARRPVARGPLPAAGARVDGRLQRLGVPAGLQEALRLISGRRVRHNDPGSEWPTHGGTMSSEEHQRIIDAANAIETAAAAGVVDVA